MDNKPKDGLYLVYILYNLYQSCNLVLMLTDEAKIIIKAGDGGNGLVSFRHEKFVPRGGPDGGDGGDGGDVIFECKSSVHTLANFASKKEFKAESGECGRKSRQTGKSGEDLILYAPPGTIIKDQNGIVADLTKEGQKITLAQGGRGGWGNWHFATATRQTPRFARPGSPGEKKELILELKILADVGLVGLPNAGKSTLISVISEAKPEIAAYPFTTKEPVLGMVEFDEHRFVVADIPGLIEGAHRGRGLGHKFLRHIERTKIIVHLIDVNSPAPDRDYQQIRKELENFSPTLIKKLEVIAFTKIDTTDKRPKIANKSALYISAVAHEGIKELLSEIEKKLEK